ncbi:aminopeptidase N-like [Aricia agestis]|uniref:aminopeptidase N-like n=1 Tax=Aricia agestis TaxID=91739 RepID=UPI001C20BC9A|nr:aminopeptidase N-like [Aricia agestis]
MLLFGILFLISASNAEYVIDEECLNYTVYPVQYELTIFPHIRVDGVSYYDCNIIITVIANAPYVNIIELDARDLDINGESIKVLDNSVDLVNHYRPFEFDNKVGKLFIYLSQPLKQYSVSRNQYYIHISFRKQVTSKSEGIFVVEHTENGRTQYLLTTRLSPNRAKYFFPCFDNPRFEAVFKFKVYVTPPQPGTQYCNTTLVIADELKHQSSKDYKIIEYISSPQVALYQVGFHHSQFGHREVTSDDKTDTICVWAPVSTLQDYTVILNAGATILNLIHDYASVKRPLVNGPINIVSVPTILNGYEIGSWNLLTNGDNRLSYHHDYTSIKQMEQMMFELTQQLCRIWLGSPGEAERTRWKDEWFKEGVATYLTYYFLTQYNHGIPKKNIPISYYGLQMKNKAMAIDWHHSTPALINFNNTLAIDIPNRYKDLVTMKTASLFWMVENWIGTEKFHQALVKYINSRRGKSVSLVDFMISLDHDTFECLNQFFNGSTASRVLNSWFHRPGYPVVNVQVLRDRQPNAIQLKQRQFSFISRNKVDSNYLIPISYIMQNNQNCYNCYQPRFTIGMQTYTFGENLDGGWIILNTNASGYYRVNYDEETWKLIAKTLKENHLSIDELNRAQIVNDIFALYAAGDIREEIARDVLEYLHKELSFVVWDSVASGFELLKMEGAAMTKTLYIEWQEFIQSKVSTVYKRLMSNTEQWPQTRLFRSGVVELACEVRLRACLNDMRRFYSDHQLANTRLNPDFRRACYYTILNSEDANIVEKLNRLELDDKFATEHKIREENRFLYKIPVGTPRPQPIIMSTSSSTTTEANELVPVNPSSAYSAISSFLTTVAAAAIVKLLN